MLPSASTRVLVPARRKLLRVRLPTPHAMQSIIEASPAKRKVINVGRRGGKTTMVARVAVRDASVGRRVLYTAPIQAQTDALWEACTTWLTDAVRTGLVTKNESKRSLIFPGGGRILARTASDPDHLRGDYADKIFFDEYAYQNPEVWTAVGAPMLLDNDGDAWFSSTPNFRNHFYLLGLRAQVDTTGRWAYFEFPSTANPHLSPLALAELTHDMTKADYEREILAQFGEGEGMVFHLIADDFIPMLPLEVAAARHLGHRIVGGLDWGQRVDYSALSLGCADCRREFHLERFRGLEYPAQRDRIRGILGRVGRTELLAEENSIGLPNIQQLRSDGIWVRGFTTSNSSKSKIVQELRLAFERRTWKWLDDPTGWRELEAYASQVTALGAQTFGAPPGIHDDTVIARMLMHHQAIAGRISRA